MAASKTLKDYFGNASAENANTTTSKRTRSTDGVSPSGLSPPLKRTDCENGESDPDFDVPENAPSWVVTLMKMMKKCTSRVDTVFDKLATIERHFEDKIAALQSEIDSVTGTATFLSSAHDSQLVFNKDQLEVNKNIEDPMKAVEQNNETLKRKCKQYEDEIDSLEQYSRRNCLLLHGVPEAEGEKTDLVFCKTVSDKLNVNIDPNMLDRSHRLGKPKTEGKPRPIIAKFARYNTRSAVFSAKKQLKGTSLLITESLTKRRVTALNEAIEKYGSKKVWTMNGEIYTKDNPKDNVKHVKLRANQAPKDKA